MIRVVFDGGPYHGRHGTVTRLRQRVAVVWAPPLPVVISSPPLRPSPWRHPARWLRWHPAPLIPDRAPAFRNVIYEDSGEVRDGAHVYTITSGWPGRDDLQ